MRENFPTGQSLEMREPQPGALYSLEAVVQLTGVSRRSILVYCKSGFIQARQSSDAEPMTFDDEAIYTIRRIDHLRSERGINLEGIRMILGLWNELRQLQDEMRFLRW
jgi:DNA-binding transcriptional MerR regulator